MRSSPVPRPARPRLLLGARGSHRSAPVSCFATAADRAAFGALGAYLVHLRTPARGTRCDPDHAPFDPAFGQR